MPGYQSDYVELNGGIKQYHLYGDGSPISVRETFEAMSRDSAIAKLMSETILSCGYQATRLETPAVNLDHLDNAFEFVLVDSPSLCRPADASSFYNQMEDRDPGESVIVFPNLRGDATMIVPRPTGDESNYTHLLDFLQHAPQHQSHSLWRSVGRTMLEQINDAPLWLSTAGGGVPWLHVRIDQRPKYYSYQPYTASS